MYPIRGTQYTLKQILLSLELQDSPCLLVNIPTSGHHPIQTSHVTNEEILSIPGIGETVWEYAYTTSEWIPVFYAVDSDSLRLKYLVVKPDNSIYASEGDMLVELLGFERGQ